MRFAVVTLALFLLYHFLLITITTSKISEIHGGIKLVFFLSGIWLGWYAISGRWRQHLPEMAGRSLHLLLFALYGYWFGLTLFQAGSPSLIICYWASLGLQFLVYQLAEYVDQFDPRRANSPRVSRQTRELVWVTIGSQIAFLLHTGII